MNIVAIIQARCGSSRFPDKIFADLQNKPLIWHVVNRLTYAKSITDIVIATTHNILDDKLYQWATENNIKIFRGPENDVLARYADVARFFAADIIIRVTADDPFKDPKLIDKAVNYLIENNVDLVCNNWPPSFPEGLDVEVFTKKALMVAVKNAKDDFEREHVTQYFYRNPTSFKIKNLTNEKDLSHLRWTIDTETDLLMVRKVYSYLYKVNEQIFHTDDILQLLKKYPDIKKINSNVARSAMYKNV